MKRLLIIILLSISSSCALFSMHLTTLVLKRSNKKHTHHYSLSPQRSVISTAKTKSLFQNRNVIASIANLATYTTTNNFCMLLPLGFQLFHEFIRKTEALEQKKQPQVQKDLVFFVKNNPTLITSLNNFREISRATNSLQDEYTAAINDAMIGKYYIANELTFSNRGLEATILGLKHKREKLKNSIISDASPFFDLYNMIDIPECIQETEQNLKQLKHLEILMKISRISSFPLAIMPYLLRNAKESSNIEIFFNTILASLFTFLECALVSNSIATHTSFFALSCCLTSLGISTYTAYKNVNEATALLVKINQECKDLEYVIEILRLQKQYAA